MPWSNALPVHGGAGWCGCSKFEIPTIRAKNFQIPCSLPKNSLFTAKNSLFHCVQSVTNSIACGKIPSAESAREVGFLQNSLFAGNLQVENRFDPGARGTLKRFHPDVTDVVDINYVPDQMRIFDTVNSTDASVSLIDVSAGLLSPTLRALRDIGFIEAAKKGHLTLVLFHMLGPSIASLDEIAETADYLGDAKYFMVKNFINNTHFFEWDEATHAAYFRRIPDAVEITIPKLPEMAAEQVELASVPFATFIANKKQSGDPASYSFVLRGYVRHWLGNVWPNTTASASPTSWEQKNPRAPARWPPSGMKLAEVT